ncbi:MAG: hypothetical protein ACFFCS_07090, partial [Candidatus Hodarchaeota archaeon]
NKDDCINECKESGRFPAKNAQGVEELEGMMMRSLYKDMKKEFDQTIIDITIDRLVDRSYPWMN